MINRYQMSIKTGLGSFIFIITTLLLAACSGSSANYLETFDEAGNWRTGDDFDIAGTVEDGAYQFHVKTDVGIFWTTAGEEFEDGVYSVLVNQTDGPIDAGYGMMMRIDDEDDSFYVFEISSDGFAKISRCLNECTDETILINDWWFETDTINQGLNSTNKLSVQAEGANFIFSINDSEVGRITDTVLDKGDIGLFVETLGLGDVRVSFDEFRVQPIE